MLIINGQKVDEEAIEQEFSAVKSHFESLGNMQCCERDDEFRGYAKDNLIGQVLLYQEAARTVEPPDEAQIDQAIADLEAEYGSREAMCFQLGLDQEDLGPLREQMGRRLRVEGLVDRLCADLGEGGSAEPDEVALRAYYQKNIEQFMTVPRVRASHILKSPEKSEQTEATYGQMVEARHALVDGTDFHETASKISDKAAEAAAAEGEEADMLGDGIDLGFFAQGELMEEFERIAFSMKVGEVSPVFSTTYGFHILKVTDRQEAEAEPFEQIQDQIREAYLNDIRQERLSELVDGLRAEADIREVDEAEADEDAVV
ncbi:MAG: peptidyl-prolyl cis-trans isomerase [Phycisphaeraceae bacterium]|nr:peptidyl-prolyl cis-trans isomerase [Phycisphaeraceae bacterium]